MTNKYGHIEKILGKHKETILYSNTPEETVELVDYYLSHEKERQELADAGYEFIHKNYNWGDHLFRLYEELHKH
jgi:spore maturation protein CgeB